MLRLYYSMIVKPGVRPRQLRTGFKRLLINACDRYFTSSGTAKLEMRNCGKEQGKKEWRCKFYAANGAGSDTRCANQNTMSQDKLRNGIPKGRETEEDQEPPGVDPQSKNLRLRENP